MIDPDGAWLERDAPAAGRNHKPFLASVNVRHNIQRRQEIVGCAGPHVHPGAVRTQDQGAHAQT